ncbi:DUF2955 domain-containing protein [Shewanella intestini]|uniref:DUF2955 domain-containing protein n=1 Tax=Shewanella intestini TaxID=2017544 RepID=A0ABS5HXV0_9GAMM|nr:MULTISPECIES: DUF2955 domain-containing protein [Shewanella]MBR9726592.1 DUF2955 domain-containing protein [Shewanella intestini]MRG34842.1 DUF2955 domain-containing protein [Shewanella sp. XMDDZSB0408]
MDNTTRGPINWSEVMWISSIVSLGMLAQIWLQLGIAAYLALFPVMAATKISNYSLLGMLKAFSPIILVACVALLVNQVFATHPAVVWCVSIWVFDRARRWADTPAKVGFILIPLLNWFLVTIFAQQSHFEMTGWIRDMAISMLTTMVVVRFVSLFLTPPKAMAPPAMPSAPVSYRQRFIFVAMLGTGLGFLMMVNLVSATFCMMPVIVAAAQSRQQNYQMVIKNVLYAHVGGCALALIFMGLLAGQHAHNLIYILSLGGLVTLIAMWISGSRGGTRGLHSEAMLGTMLPLQLYVSASDLGLHNIYFRGELMLTVLVILVICQGVIYGTASTNNDNRHS